MISLKGISANFEQNGHRTLRYGNITPLTSFGMTAAYTEAVFGQLYLVILVARLVGLYIARSDASDHNN